MKKIVMILDQIQAGAGGKEKSNIPPAGKSSPLLTRCNDGAIFK